MLVYNCLKNLLMGFVGRGDHIFFGIDIRWFYREDGRKMINHLFTLLSTFNFQHNFSLTSFFFNDLNNCDMYHQHET